jgi:DNA-binding MarR family transcriptional regulator
MANSFQIEDALCFNLYSASRMMNKAYGPSLEKFDLTYPQFLVMTLLWSKDDVSLNDLGERVLLDSGTLTPLINRLIKKKLIQKVKSKQDQRGILIRLTKTGRELQLKTKHVPMEMFCKLNLTESQFGKVRDAVREVLLNLQSHNASEPGV